MNPLPGVGAFPVLLSLVGEGQQHPGLVLLLGSIVTVNDVLVLILTFSPSSGEDEPERLPGLVEELSEHKMLRQIYSTKTGTVQFFFGTPFCSSAIAGTPS